MIARSVVLLGLVLTLSGCVASLGDFAHRDLSGLGGDRVLLLGRIDVILHGLRRTGSIAIETSAKEAGGYQLDGAGDVAWSTTRGQGDLRLSWLSGSDDAISLGGEGPLLAPASAPEPIIYFGTIRIRSDAAGVHYDVIDDAEETLGALGRINPSLVGRRYYHTLRRAVLVVPGAAPLQARSQRRPPGPSAGPGGAAAGCRAAGTEPGRRIGCRSPVGVTST